MTLGIFGFGSVEKSTRIGTADEELNNEIADGGPYENTPANTDNLGIRMSEEHGSGENIKAIEGKSFLKRIADRINRR